MSGSDPHSLKLVLKIENGFTIFKTSKVMTTPRVESKRSEIKNDAHSSLNSAWAFVKITERITLKVCPKPLVKSCFPTSRKKIRILRFGRSTFRLTDYFTKETHETGEADESLDEDAFEAQQFAVFYVGG